MYDLNAMTSCHCIQILHSDIYSEVTIFLSGTDVRMSPILIKVEKKTLWCLPIRTPMSFEGTDIQDDVLGSNKVQSCAKNCSVWSKMALGDDDDATPLSF